MWKIIIGAAAVVILIVVLVIVLVTRKNSQNSPDITPEDFERRKKTIRPNSSKEEFDAFFRFVKQYKGGFYKRRHGELLYRDYTGKEKGDLKGIFFNSVFPNPNISVEDKEEFRAFLIAKGVTGVNARPDYETRDARLKNRNADEDDFERKEVGNKGEEAVRKKLNNLRNRGYLVINGPMLKDNDVTREFDHIVIGDNGVFVLETKAFGASKEGSDRASLFIDKGDKWILRKNGYNRELKSPTEQILAERDHLKNILHAAKEKVEVKPVLVLSNKELFLKNNIKLEYEVVSVNNLEETIAAADVDRIFEEEKQLIAQIIDDHRVNN